MTPAHTITVKHYNTCIQRSGMNVRVNSDGIIQLHNHFHSTRPMQFRTNCMPCSRTYSNILHTVQTCHHVIFTSKEAINNCMMVSNDRCKSLWYGASASCPQNSLQQGFLYQDSWPNACGYLFYLLQYIHEHPQMGFSCTWLIYGVRTGK